MGSYIVQCFASKQSIAEDMPCRIVPLLQGRDYRPAKCTLPGKAVQDVYAPSLGPGVDGKWEPVLGFLEAVSGDCGQHELLETPNNVRVFSNLLCEMAQRCAVVELGENSSHEKAFSMPAHLAEHAPLFWGQLKERTSGSAVPLIDWAEATTVWEELHPYLRTGRVFMADWESVARPLTFGVMHEFSYEWFRAQGESTPRLGTELHREAYVPSMIAKGIEEGKRYTDESLNAAVNESLLVGQVQSALREGLRLIGDNCIKAISTHQIVRNALREHLHEGKSIEDAFLVPLKAILDDQYVLRGLDLCHITLEPAHYADQDYQNDVGTLFAQFVAEAAKHVNAAVETKYNEF